MGNIHRDVNKLMDGVSVPTSRLNHTVNYALEEGKRQKRRSFHNKHRFFASIASIFVLAIATLLFTTYEQKNASLSVEDSIFATSPYGNVGLKRMVEEGRVTDLSLVAEDNGVMVTLKEGYFDNNQLVFSYSMEMSEDFYEKTLDKDFIMSVEYFTDGVHLGGHSTSSGHPQGLIRNGILTVPYNVEKIQSNSEIGLDIEEINGVEGNWSFHFQLEKEEEFIHMTENLEFEDGMGNVFTVQSVKLSPSKLDINLWSKLVPRDDYDELSRFNLAVLVKKGNELFFEPVLRRSSNSNNAYDLMKLRGSLREEVEVARGYDAYDYQIIPYIATYNGEKIMDDSPGIGYVFESIVVPLEKGAVLDLETPIKVLDIFDQGNNTVVRYEMEEVVPVFPVILEHGLTLDMDNERGEYLPISFTVHNDYVEVKYPKLDEIRRGKLELHMYDAAFQTFPNLDIRLNLK